MAGYEIMKKDMAKIEVELMETGCLCPDYTIHEWELLEWEGNIRNMKCKKCGKITGAMAKTLPLE